jgi:hypothetical protein
VRFSRVVLVSMVSVVLVSIGIAVGVYVADAGSEAPTAKVTFSKPLIGDVPPGPPKDLTAIAADAFNRAAVELAGEIVTPQTIANVFYFTQSLAALKP